MKMPKLDKFPKTLYVKIEQDGTERYFVSAEALAELVDIGEQTKVAVYFLEEVGTAVVDVSFR